MKKFLTLLLILIYLLFNRISLKPTSAANVFTEGVYKISDFNFAPNNIYNIQNISPSSGVTIAVFDKNQTLQQTIRLEPKSESYNLLPLSPTDRIMIIGNGEVYIN